MHATGQIFQRSKFPDTLSFVLAKFDIIGQIHLPHEFAQSGCIPSKIICEILASRKQKIHQRGFTMEII